MSLRMRLRLIGFGSLFVGVALIVALTWPEPAPRTAPLASPARSVPSPTAAATSAPADAAAMLRVHNGLRTAVGAPSLAADDRVSAAARSHAEYLAARSAVGHEETPGEAGFTGATVGERLAAQGYPGALASEVAIAFAGASEGVRSLWDLPYHRLGMMHPHAVVAGWGHAELAGRTATVGVIVFDFAAPAPERVLSPAPDQRVPGSWHGEESPDVLPAGAARPVGPPIMAVFSRARLVELRAASLTEASGRELAYHVVPQIYERDYVAIVPTAPLTPGARYRVRLALVVAGVDVVEEWGFGIEP